MTDTRGALVAAVAYAVMWWLDRRPPSWWYGQPRPKPPTTHQTPTQVRIIRPGPGRDLDRRQP